MTSSTCVSPQRRLAREARSVAVVFEIFWDKNSTPPLPLESGGETNGGAAPHLKCQSRNSLELCISRAHEDGLRCIMSPEGNRIALGKDWKVNNSGPPLIYIYRYRSHLSVQILG